tara:strand:- start:1010 stop:1609 length:600 start_codon:yes stop_codon:yes gene_type:complete
VKTWVKIEGTKYHAKQTERELKRVAKLWRRRAQYRLKKGVGRGPINATGSLSGSMRLRWGMDGETPYADITPQVDYWRFVDAGVRGTVGPYPDRWGRDPDNPDRIFAYKDKKPPISAINMWIQQKGLQQRGEGGRFAKTTGMAFGIQTMIYTRGLRPTYFLSDTGAAIEQKYAQKIAEAYAQDLEHGLDQYWATNTPKE